MNGTVHTMTSHVSRKQFKRVGPAITTKRLKWWVQFLRDSARLNMVLSPKTVYFFSTNFHVLLVPKQTSSFPFMHMPKILRILSWHNDLSIQSSMLSQFHKSNSLALSLLRVLPISCSPPTPAIKAFLLLCPLTCQKTLKEPSISMSLSDQSEQDIQSLARQN